MNTLVEYRSNGTFETVSIISNSTRSYSRGTFTTQGNILTTTTTHTRIDDYEWTLLSTPNTTIRAFSISGNTFIATSQD